MPKVALQIGLTMIESEHKPWTRDFTGNKPLFYKTRNQLRYFLQVELKQINLQEFPNRPKDPVNLSIGDPTNSSQFKTNPTNIQFLKKNVGKIDGYTNFSGCDEARQSVAKFFPAPNYKITKDNVSLWSGGSMALFASIMVLAQHGDNFIFPSPGFPLSRTISAAFGIEVRQYHLDPNNNWKANLQEMESLIDAKTKFIFINDPSNPLGSCWPQEHKKQIIDLARRKNLPIVADEIYEGVTYGKPVKTFAELATEEVTIFKCSGLTKRWLGPGWRLGWIIVYTSQQKLKMYQQALKGISNVFLMPHSIVQSAVKQILQNPQNDEYLAQRMPIMGRNQQLLLDHLKDQDYCQVGSASGALYATILVKLQKFDKNKFPTMIEFCKLLYSQENTLIFPDKFFGGEQQPFIRLTISCSNSIVEEFITRFKRFCRHYLKKAE